MDTRIPTTEHEALIEGQRAGVLDVPAGANPYEMGTAEAREWERGRSTISARKLAESLRRRARTAPCRYIAETDCTCGGRGLCLDVA